ncbi:hypothetical protein FNV43_RR09158 [Rhamnella rubrinervis]|uniref:Cytochrome P450 n=1 Tax=Rhamnella rubrinervis TaxID=2594499 RepID=A0A8K0MK33_9ROSA|nr:hypothetical protein FNV43_RR09158 [Rhamnella rubrinervis]
MESYSFLLLSLILLICTHFLVNLKRWVFVKRKLPPGPTGLPILGNIIAIGQRPHESLANMAKKHGPLMTVQLGYNTTVVASSIEMAKEFLQKNDQACLGRPVPDAITAQHDYEVAMAWISGGPRWRKLRKLCNSQVFTTQRLDALQELRNQMYRAMVERLRKQVKRGGRVYWEEIKELVARIMFLGGKPNISDYFPFLKPFDLQHLKRDIEVSYHRLHSLLDNIIDQRQKRRESKLPRCDDFLDVLLDNYQFSPEELSLAEIKTMLTDLFIGGTDTSSTTIEWVMTELLRHPKVMDKLKQELADTISLGQSIEEKDIPRLPYLQAVLKESLRLHPAAPLLLPHQAQMDVQVCGYTIPKGTHLVVNSWCISRDPVNWPDRPTEFIPERFLDSKLDFRGTNLCFTPFGSGRRICPGLSLSVRMLSLSLGNLVHHFDWKLPDGMAPEDIDIGDKFGITLQKAIPLVAIPTLVN